MTPGDRLRASAGVTLFALLALAGGAGCGGGGGPTDDLAYRSLCAGCHGVDGRGNPGMYPPLDGHLPRLLEAEGGRAYVLEVVSFGVEGPVDARGAGWDTLMPAVKAATDADLARALNHASRSWSNAAALPAAFAPFTEAEVASTRVGDQAPHEVRRRRPPLPPWTGPVYPQGFDAAAPGGDGAGP